MPAAEIDFTRPLVRGFAIDEAATKVREDAVWVETVPQGWLVHLSVSDPRQSVGRADEIALSAPDGGETRSEFGFSTERDRPSVTMTLTVHRDFGVVGFEATETRLRLAGAVTMSEAIEAMASGIGGLSEAPAAAVALRNWRMSSRKSHTKGIKQRPERVLDEIVVATNIAATRILRENARGLLYLDVGEVDGTGRSKRITTDPSGHDVVTVGAYAQFTSPLRRISDLVNLRCLMAATHGEPEPYTSTELIAIAEAANKAMETPRRSDRMAVGEISPDMPREQFLDAVRLAWNDGANGDLAAEAERRVAVGALAVEDFPVVFMHPRSPVASRAKRLAAAALKLCEEAELRHFWSAACSSLGCKPPSFKIATETRGSFKVDAEVAGLAAVGEGASPREARLDALVKLAVLALDAGDDDTVDFPVPPFVPAARTLPSLASKLGLGTTRLSFIDEGDVRRATLSFSNSELTFDAVGSSRRWAGEAAYTLALDAVASMEALDRRLDFSPELLDELVDRHDGNLERALHNAARSCGLPDIEIDPVTFPGNKENLVRVAFHAPGGAIVETAAGIDRKRAADSAFTVVYERLKNDLDLVKDSTAKIRR